MNRDGDLVPFVGVERWSLLDANGLNIPNIVITDGDPDVDGDLEGIARGRGLVGRKTRARVDAALANDDIDEAGRALRDGNVFVGAITLELDLIATARDAMYDAYAELEPSATKQVNFGRDLAASASASLRSDPPGCQRRRSRPVSGSTPSYATT